MNVRRLDPAPLVVGCWMALAGGLFLAEPFVAPVPVDGVPVPATALAFVALAVALDLGAVLFYWQGRRAAALSHGVAGLGWTLLILGPVLGSTAVWVAGLAVVVGGAVFLAAEMVRTD